MRIRSRSKPQTPDGGMQRPLFETQQDTLASMPKMPPMRTRVSDKRPLFVVALIFFVLLGCSRAQDDAACRALDTCTDCIAGGCAWSISTCTVECAADAPCVPADSTEADCAAYEAAQMDSEACRAQTTCTGCVETALPSDAMQTCKWFVGDFCDSVCQNFDGCEEVMTCRDDSTCDFDTCNDCIAGGCAWSVSACATECAADASCVPADSTEEDCAAYEAAQMDSEACQAQMTCTGCVETALPSDPMQTCKWFIGDFCDSVCQNFDGCEEVMMCPDDPASTCDFDSCTDCIAGGCAWSVSACATECAADASCVPADSTEADCDAYESAQMDSEACQAQTTCTGCVETALPSDAMQSCKWFVGDFCDSVCQNFDGCEEVMMCPDDSTCDFDTCTDCIAGGCAWSVSACATDCAADASCVPADSTEADCAAYEAAQMDSEACLTQTTCAGCVETALPSNAMQTCKWFEGDFCDSVCMIADGCEEVMTCPDDPDSTCGFGTCTECIEGGCAWSQSTCSTDCVADVSCVPADSTEDDCITYESNEMDSEACQAMKSCVDCVEMTLPSDSTQSCKWFEGDFCDSVCMNFDGCEEVMTCPDDPGSTCDFDSCTECIEGGCAWSLSTCSTDCVADASCVPADSTGEDCATYEENQMDSETCQAKKSCVDCVVTTLPSDSTQSCKWFEGDFCDSVCMNFDGCEEVMACPDTTEFTGSTSTGFSVNHFIALFLVMVGFIVKINT